MSGAKNTQRQIFLLSHVEMEYLYGLNHFYQLLYVYLRKRMDKTTGMVGARNGQRISLSAIAEWLYVESGPGIKNSGSPSIGKIRTALGALASRGVIKFHSIVSKERRQLILSLPYAALSRQAQNKVSMDLACQFNMELSRGMSGLSVENSESEEENSAILNKEVSALDKAKVSTPQPINIKTNYSSDRAISEHYMPSAQILQKAAQVGVVEFHSPMELQKFIAYNKSRDTQSADWDSQYLYWLINAKQYQSKGARYDATAGKGYLATKGKKLSAVDEVRQRNRSTNRNAVIDVGTGQQEYYLPIMGEPDPGIRS